MTIGVKLTNEGFFNDVAEELRLFFPMAHVVLTRDSDEMLEMNRLHNDVAYSSDDETTTLRVQASGADITAEFQTNGRIFCATLPYPIMQDALLQKRHLKRAYKLAVYRALKSGWGRPSPWGSLTGIRPTKFVRGLYDEFPARSIDSPCNSNTSNAQASAVRDALLNEFDLREDKVELLAHVIETQEKLLHRPRFESKSMPILFEASEPIDVYIGIPFCATRCSYCSFAAEALKDYSRVEAYMEALFREIDGCREIAEGFGVRALYIGGGTPTSLAPREFELLLEKAAGLSPALEFAVEAGRPDTLSTQMLDIMRRYGVTRTSVNPQTMSNATLSRIGRAHSAEDTVKAFELTKGYGIPVNADIIVGLPGETRRDVEHTLDMLEILAPEGFTAHTLALKRASRMVMSGESALPSAEEAEAMLALTQDFAHRNGMNPYYLYRQKYMAGNLENVGYAKPGFECIYNIDIMEETTSILAFGAGAITKWIFGGGRLERSPNPKDIGTYVGKTEELVRRKIVMLGDNC